MLLLLSCISDISSSYPHANVITAVTIDRDRRQAHVAAPTSFAFRSDRICCHGNWHDNSRVAPATNIEGPIKLFLLDYPCFKSFSRPREITVPVSSQSSDYTYDSHSGYNFSRAPHFQYHAAGIDHKHRTELDSLTRPSGTNARTDFGKCSSLAV